MTDKPQFVGQKVKLSDICSIVSGATPKTTVKDYWGGDIKWITPSELNDDSHVIYNTAKHLTEAGFASARLRMFPEGTVLLTTRAPIGKVAIAGEPMCCNQGFKNLVCSDAVNNEYLYRYLKNRSSELQVLGRGATFKELSKKEVAAYEINLPPLKRQLEAVEKLALVDKQVVIAKTQLDKLDSLVKSRFIEMFGDPIRNPLRMSVSSVEELAAPIKNSMKAGPFGSALKKEVYAESGYKVYGQEQVISGDQFLGNYYIDKEKYEQLNSCKVMPGDVLISLVGTVGKVLILSEDCQPGIINPRLVKITFDKRKIFPEYFAIAFSLESVRSSLLGKAHGQTMNVLNLGMIKKLKLPVPPISRQKEYLNFVAQVDKSRFVAQQQIEKLQMLYDSLAQEYFGD
ncbi:restriction endonuclease subunit S [Bifidobacterium adolescentis]|uniref:restriction endonuclease subunit S n=1 Tax=Bifidobacterium adolescentis TaxID=1680 RepID=UPI0022E34625|nr:restriction endonuclease subunit S [Bifidobacterium adolescentis]